MSFRIRDTGRTRLSIAMLLVSVCACRQLETVRDEASTEEPPAGRGVTSAPFADGEAWILSSDTTTGESGLAYINMSGLGDLVSSIEVITDVFTNESCSIQSPSSAFGGLPRAPNSDSIDFEFDGSMMSITANSQGDEFFEGCSVEFTVSVNRHGTEQALFGVNVFDVSVQGQALVSGEPVRFAPMQLNRFRTPKPIACEEAPTSLAGASFTISSVQPAASLFGPISPDATVVSISGSEDTVTSVSLASGVFQTCFGSEGTISFDGTSFVFESSFPSFQPLPFDPDCNDDCQFQLDGRLAFNGQCDDGREGAATSDCPAGSDCADCGPLIPLVPPTGEGQDGGEGELPEVEPPTCSITFSGKVTECGVYLSPFFGFPVGQEVLTISGRGSYTDGESSGELTVLYLTISRNGDGLIGP